MTRTRPITFPTSAAAMPLTAWQPLLAPGTPTTGTGLTVFKLDTIAPSGSSQQVTYTGHPVYPYGGDKEADEVNGRGATAFGGAWSALTSAGNQTSAQPTASGGSYGY
jgi:hypothetical protein